MSKVEQEIQLHLGYGLREVQKILERAHKQVRLIRIKKKTGKYRIVYHPSRKLKAIQLFLAFKYLSMIRIHESATAYVKGSSNIKNAIAHRRNERFLKIDFENFFESLKWSDLKEKLRLSLEAAGYESKDVELISDIVRKSCFYEDKLRQGYPTSPIISNIVMYDLDVLITDLARLATGDHAARYTRYADDVVVSYVGPTNQKEILSKIQALVNQTKGPTLSLNKDKTAMFSRSSGAASITGVRICADQRLTMFRRTKDEIRLLLNLCRKGSLAREGDAKKTLGLLAYAKMIDPSFYSKIYSKYFKEIVALKSSVSIEP